jgi:hypothetical protein
MFNVEITPLNGAGILVVLAGSARYSYVCVTEKTKPAAGESIVVASPSPSTISIANKNKGHRDDGDYGGDEEEQVELMRQENKEDK